MFDHIGLVVKDFPRSVAFNERCFAPLGISRMEGGEADGNNAEAALRE